MNLDSNFPQFVAKFGYPLTLHDAVVHRIYPSEDGALFDLKFRLFSAPVGEEAERRFAYVLRFIKPSSGVHGLRVGDEIYSMDITTANGVVTVSATVLPSGETVSFSCWGIEEVSLEEWSAREPYRIRPEERSEIENLLIRLVGASVVDLWRLVGNQRFVFSEDPLAPEDENGTWTIVAPCPWKVLIGGVSRLDSSQFGRTGRTDDPSVYELIYDRLIVGYSVSDIGGLEIRIGEDVLLQITPDPQAEDEDQQWRIIPPDKNTLALHGAGLRRWQGLDL